MCDMKLRDRAFKPNAATMLIEHRSTGAPTVPTFLRVTEHERFTEYELTRSLRGKQLLHIFIPKLPVGQTLLTGNTGSAVKAGSLRATGAVTNPPRDEIEEGLADA